MITFYCPHCQHRMEVADNFIGKTGQCEKCERPVTVPEESESPPATSLDDLANLPDQAVSPESIGAYGKAADKRWVDPAAKEAKRQAEVAEAERQRKLAEAKVKMPEIPEDVLAKVRERRRKTMNFVLLAAGLTLLLAFLSLPAILSWTNRERPAVEVEQPQARPNAPEFGVQDDDPQGSP